MRRRRDAKTGSYSFAGPNSDDRENGEAMSIKRKSGNWYANIRYEVAGRTDNITINRSAARCSSTRKRPTLLRLA